MLLHTPGRRIWFTKCCNLTTCSNVTNASRKSSSLTPPPHTIWGPQTNGTKNGHCQLLNIWQFTQCSRPLQAEPSDSQSAVTWHHLFQRHKRVQEVLLTHPTPHILVHIGTWREHVPRFLQNMVQWPRRRATVADECSTLLIATESTRLRRQAERHFRGHPWREERAVSEDAGVSGCQVLAPQNERGRQRSVVAARTSWCVHCFHLPVNT